MTVSLDNATAEAPDDDLALAARTALARLVGRPQAQFRDGQLEAVTALVRDSGRVLVVQRTGWGKSAVYFVATALLRQGWAGRRPAGPTLIVSPLLALMRDQIAAAGRAGIRAATMNSANAQEWGQIRAALEADAVDVLLVSPERLNNPRFRDEQLPDLSQRCGLLVVDEAHCISDWGHDFRPDYRRIRDLLTTLGPATPVLATTATANARVVADVVEQLGTSGADGRPQQVVTLRGRLARDSLRLGVLPVATPEQRIAWLAAHLGELTGSGIIYALTVAAAHDVAAALREAGHDVRAYTGRSDTAERELLEEALRRNEIKALVATSALGMGFDKPDLGFVVHLGAPSSPVAYYQQVGRAGRATEHADVLLLPGSEDSDIWSYFASASMPREHQAAAVIDALTTAAPSALSTAALETIVDVRRTRLELLLKVLDVDGAVRRVSGGWTATGRDWVYDTERYARVAGAREREQQLMLDYQRAPTEPGARCRMRFLAEALDDPSAADCGRCDVCAGPWVAADAPEAAVRAARARLARVGVELEPRSMWPSGMDRLGVPVKGRIAPELGMGPGRAVARLSDLGWGQRLRALLDGADAPPPSWLAEATIEVLKGWDWQRRPVAVAALPARRRPQLVTGIAAGLADVGRLTYLGELAPVDGGPRGGPGGNSAFRLAGVWRRIGVTAAQAEALAALDGPVLLVDDLAASRWTLTVAAAALREAGAVEVLPFALALDA